MRILINYRYIPIPLVDFLSKYCLILVTEQSSIIVLVFISFTMLTTTGDSKLTHVSI